MSNPTRLPGIYTERAKTNPSNRRVPALATGVMVINAHKGLLNQRDIVTSASEFIAKYGDLQNAADLSDHRAALAFLAKGRALYVVRVRRAETASKALIHFDAGTSDPDAGGGDTGGGLSDDRWLVTDTETDWDLNGAGSFNSAPSRYTAVYDANSNRSEIKIIQAPGSDFIAANLFKFRFVHNTGFPIQLDITDETGTNYHTDGYISGTDIDLRLSGLAATEAWSVSMLVLGQATFTASAFEFFVYGPDADVIEGV